MVSSAKLSAIIPPIVDNTPSSKISNLFNIFPQKTPIEARAAFKYFTQSGDTLHSVAARFRVRPQDITSNEPIPGNVFLPPGQLLYIPLHPEDVPTAPQLLPDSEVIFSPSVIDFDVVAYVEQAGGYLSTRRELMYSTGMTSGAEILARVAQENSFNPRLLLSFLEYQCGCVLGFPGEGVDEYDLMGLEDPLKRGLYRQLGWAVNQLSLGYYGWRNGMITQFYFPDGTVSRVPPTLNAGSVAIEYLFAQLYDSHGWRQATDLNEGLPALHKRMFGDPWQRSQAAEPLLPPGLSQPQLILPFMPNQIWSYTSGPHKAWETDGALAALDFAPPSVESGCLQSDIWIVAVANGLVVRSEHGAVVLDLDNEGMDSNASFSTSDGMEQTGWAILYMHVEDRGRVARGTRLRTGDPIGHPSCEGGPASGTHMHIARKYNGEWAAAGGPIPFVMDGWLAHSGYQPFEGTLTRDGITITANIFSPSYTFISREIEETTIPKRFNLKNRFRRRLCD